MLITRLYFHSYSSSVQSKDWQRKKDKDPTLHVRAKVHACCDFLVVTVMDSSGLCSTLTPSRHSLSWRKTFNVNYSTEQQQS